MCKNRTNGWLLELDIMNVGVSHIMGVQLPNIMNVVGLSKDYEYASIQ